MDGRRRYMHAWEETMPYLLLYTPTNHRWVNDDQLPYKFPTLAPRHFRLHFPGLYFSPQQTIKTSHSSKKMSRPALLRPFASIPRQSFAVRAPAAAGIRFINSKVGSTRGAGAVDYRVLEGIDGFLPKENFDRLKEWQLGLWGRLQAEVQSESGIRILG